MREDGQKGFEHSSSKVEALKRNNSKVDKKRDMRIVKIRPFGPIRLAFQVGLSQ